MLMAAAPLEPFPLWETISSMEAHRCKAPQSAKQERGDSERPVFQLGQNSYPHTIRRQLCLEHEWEKPAPFPEIVHRTAKKFHYCPDTCLPAHTPRRQ